MQRLDRAAKALLHAEAATHEARVALYAAIKAAHTSGASLAAIGRIVGLSRQRVAHIVKHGE